MSSLSQVGPVTAHGDEPARAARRAGERVDELAPGLERLHHPVEGADVEVDPAAPAPLGDADDRGREHAGLGDERAARLGDHLNRVRQRRRAPSAIARPYASSGGIGSA